MSSLLICRTVNISKESMAKLGVAGSMIDPNLIPGGAKSDEYERLTEALEAAEARERKTGFVNKALAVGSFTIALTGLWISWSRFRSEAR